MTSVWRWGKGNLETANKRAGSIGVKGWYEGMEEQTVVSYLTRIKRDRHNINKEEECNAFRHIC